jgi:Co/Zn/Cd efflux system component
MSIGFIIFDIALVAWSLSLMQAAVDRQEFSFMLAGILVAFAAAGTLVVYSVIHSYFGFLDALALGTGFQ